MTSLAAVVLTLWTAGCKSDPEPEDPAPSDAATAGDPGATDLKARLAQLREAHGAMLQRAQPVAQPVLADADPTAVWALGRGPLRPPPHTPVSLSGVTTGLAKAKLELDDIHNEYLDPSAAVQRMCLGVGLARIDEAAGGHAMTRVDPLVGLHEGNMLLDRAHRATAAGDDEDLGAALSALEVAMRVYYKDLGAASKASLDAAIVDFEAFAKRVEGFGGRHTGAAEAASKLAATAGELRTRLVAQAAALPDEANLQWTQWPPPVNGQPKLLRLPDVLGRAALRQRLEVEEGLDRDPVEAVPQLLELAARLDAISAQHGGLEKIDLGAESAVTAARCDEAMAALGGKLDGAPGMTCGGFVAVWGDRSWSDAQLRLQLVDAAWVDAAVRTRRRAAPDWIGLLSGRTVPFSHRALTSVSLAMRTGDEQTLALAHRRMRDAVCLATTAIWIHAELPDRPKLDKWLATDCPDRQAESWVAAVQARPRSALDGLALALAASGPAGATMLAIAPWAPLGVVPPYANPYRRSVDQEAKMEFEALDDFLGDPSGPR